MSNNQNWLAGQNQQKETRQVATKMVCRVWYPPCNHVTSRINKPAEYQKKSIKKPRKASKNPHGAAGRGGLQ